MSQVATRPIDPPPEAFGQKSVASGLRTFLANTSLIVALFCAVMWVRSADNFDSAQFSVNGTRFIVNSAIDRLIIIHGRSSDTRWSVDSREIGGDTQDGWQPSLLKTIGVQTGRGSLGAGINRAYWIRVRWRTLFIVGMLAPAMHWAERMRARRRERPNPSLPPFCPECGTDLRAAKRKCPECGRSFH